MAMLSRLTQVPRSATCLPNCILVSKRTAYRHWDRIFEENHKPRKFNRAETNNHKNRPYTFDNYHPDGVYYRQYVLKSGPREWGKFRMDFSGYESALAVCKGGMVNVTTLPARPGEFLDPAPAPLKFPDGILDQRKAQDKELEKWRWWQPSLLPTESDRPPSFYSLNEPLVDQLPGTSNAWSSAVQVWKKDGRSQLRKNLGKGYLLLNSRYQMWYHEGGFDKDKFLQDAVDTYIMAHQAARDKNYERLKDTALEFMIGSFQKRFNHYRQLWRCWNVTEKPRIMGRYCQRVKTFDNALVAQVFVRLKTREEHVAYNRIGERMAGVEGEQVDMDQVVLFERLIDGGASVSRCWRIVMIIKASEMETWRPVRVLSEGGD